MKNEVDVLKQYDIRLSLSGPDDETPLFSSPITELCLLFNENITLSKAKYLYDEISEISNQSDNDIELAFSEVTKQVILYPSLLNQQNESYEVFCIPKSDLLSIITCWLQFVASLVSCDVEITDGQGIIKIINDSFSNVLIIQRPVAINWPDCHGSVGEYYAIADFNDDQSKLLTENLDFVLQTGTNKEVFNEISNFLKLFDNGFYHVFIRSSNLAEFEICHDEMVSYSRSVPAEERFTGWLYSSMERDKVIFSRSYNSIDHIRVQYYVDLIRSGVRPKILFYTHYLDYDFFSCPFYVIDGHHKLLAYMQLRVDADIVFITKDDYSGIYDKEIILAAKEILKPNEFRHYLSNGSTEDINVFMQKDITVALDQYLLNEKSINTSIIEMIYNAYHSGYDNQREWAEGRFTAIIKNKYKGKGQFLYYKYRNDDSESWMRMEIKKKKDFEIWKEMYIRGGVVPEYLRYANIPREHKPYYVPPKEPEYYKGEWTFKEIVLTIAIILLLLVLIFK